MINDKTKALIDKVIDNEFIELQNVLGRKEPADTPETLYNFYPTLIRMFDSCFEFENYIADDVRHTLRDFWFAVKDNDAERIKYDLDKVLECTKEAMAKLAQIAAKTINYKSWVIDIQDYSSKKTSGTTDKKNI